MENQIKFTLKNINDTKTILKKALEDSPLKDWELMEVKLVEKGGNINAQNSCRIIEKSDGTIEIICN